MQLDVRRGSTRAPALLAVFATTVQEVGAAVAVGLFDALGVAGTVCARFFTAAVILGIGVRPKLRGLTRRHWDAVVRLAVTMTVMNLCFYGALSRIQLGVAVTVEICGPLLLSVILSRGRSRWAWASTAFAGVAILGLSRAHMAESDAIGLALAACAAISWAGYILATANAGRVFANLDALALATVLGCLLTTPLAAISIDIDTALRWQTAGLVVVVGLMCSVIPYSLELISLRILPASIFGILTSLSPAIAALAGWVVLHQRLGMTDCIAAVLVVVASIGAVRCTPADIPATGTSSPPSRNPEP